MKSMTCRQLGGPCDLVFQGKTADEIIQAQDAHLKEVVAKGDRAHAEALKSMQARWKNPIAGLGWYLKMKMAFAKLPEMK